MEWLPILLVIVTLLIVLFFVGIPVAFAFLILNLICLYIWAGGVEAWFLLINSAFDVMTNAGFLAVSSFVLMGEILFHTEVSTIIINALDKWVGRIPGRLGLLAVLAGTLLATMTGSSMGATVMVASVLVPEMRKHGYKGEMSIGACAASGVLGPLIPPTIMGVIVAGLVKVSIGDFLIAIIVPGLVLAALFAIYIVVRARIQPSVAPPYAGEQPSFLEKIRALGQILPIGIIIFFVLGMIFLGFTTPGEAAALGVVGTLIVCVLYRKLNWNALKKALISSAQITVMLFMICVGSIAFSQIIAYTGAARGMTAWVVGHAISPLGVYIWLLLVVLFLGCLMDGLSVTMITIPIFVPIMKAMGFDLMWFSVVLLVGVETGMITPPFGLNLFAVKAVSPENTIGEVYASTFPYVICCIIALVLLYVFPELVSWLPGLMR